jgi:hypothetical protein
MFRRIGHLKKELAEQSLTFWKEFEDMHRVLDKLPGYLKGLLMELRERSVHR